MAVKIVTFRLRCSYCGHTVDVMTKIDVDFEDLPKHRCLSVRPFDERTVAAALSTRR